LRSDENVAHPALLFVALTLTAIGLAPGIAHLLELPVKLAYPPADYAAVTSTLYRWFGVVGGGVQTIATLAVALLAYRMRHEAGAMLSWVAVAALVCSLAIWGGAVAPVNSAWAAAGTPGSASFVDAYARLRLRWEFGHVAALVSWLVGWFALVGVVVGHPGRPA
jgi:hypothetical protein